RGCRVPHDLVDIVPRRDVVGERDATEAARAVVGDCPISGELVSSPQDDRHAAGLKEDGLFDLLPLPSQAVVERARPCEVSDAEGDEADALIHDKPQVGFSAAHRASRPRAITMRWISFVPSPMIMS